MSKFKKIFCIVLTLFIVLGLMSGCEITKKEPALKQDSGEDNAPKVPDLKPYEINWYIPGSAQKDVALVEEAANNYLKDKINASLKLVFMTWADYASKVNVMLQSGEYFDICFTSDWSTPKYRTSVAAGLFTPLNDPLNNLLDQYAPKTKAVLGEDVLKGTRINGLNYAIPCNKEMARCRGFLFNKELVDKYKFDLTTIKKYQDVEPMLKVIKENEPDIYPNNKGGIPLDWNFITDTDVPLATYTKAGAKEVLFWYETPEYQELIRTVNKWWKLGYIRQDFNTSKEDDVKNYKVFCADYTLKPGKDAEISNQYGNKWVQVMITPTIMSNVELGGSMQAIPRSSKDPARVMMLLELINTDPYMNNLINFGIEDKHYVKVSDNIIDFAPGTDGGKNSGYNPAMSWVVGNVFINYLFKTEDPRKAEKYLEFNKSAIVMETLGFSFNNTPVKTEIAAIKNVFAEYNSIMALNPDENIPKAIAKFEAAGIRKVQEEAQKQLDEYLSKTKK
ncbi:MAG TPA: ABC transporter substrate-binding protein [Clostridiales bacterium]|nr:ABC transporter substrate-binding protein [Clostridiales bacterium]